MKVALVHHAGGETRRVGRAVAVKCALEAQGHDVALHDSGTFRFASDAPDASGSERIVIKDATFDSLILADWEVDKMGDESYSFTFSDWDLLDLA